MAAFLTFSRSNNNANKSERNQQSIDQWRIIGVSTSTSTSSSGEDTLLSTKTPPTPEGLRPRKTIQRIREDIMGPYHHQDLHHRCIRSSSIQHHGSLQHGSNPATSSSVLEQPLERENDRNNGDIDIDSEVENDQYSHLHEHKFGRKHIASSPNLKRGGKAKTAVGALLVAMAESSTDRNNPSKDRSYDSILPPRTWMDHQVMNNYVAEDDTIEYDMDEDVYDDIQSSLHASPSSNRLGRQRQDNLQLNTSFTRGILHDENNLSWQEEKHHTGDRSPYNFSSIMSEEDDIGNSAREKIHDAPRVLTLPNDNNGLNISAISHSQHQKDINTLCSFADTMEDENNESREIPLYYQALTDESDVIKNNTHTLVANDSNERRMKENLLRSAFERLQDNTDMLNEILDVRISLFLGLRTMESDRSFFRFLEGLLFELNDKDPFDTQSFDTQRQAILFCLSLIQNKNPSSDNTNPLSIYLSNYSWKPMFGFRSHALGLEEESQSPTTVRGGDTSIFSLPSDSANDSTPHTSNVSMTTTITTVVSPERDTSHFFKNQHDNVDWSGMRRTVKMLTNLIQRLELSCLEIESNMSAAKKTKVIETIERVFCELLVVPTRDLKLFINAFEMKLNCSDFLSCENNEMEQKNEKENTYQPKGLARKVNVFQYEDNENKGDNQNQCIECNLQSPSSNTMHVIEDNADATTTNVEYTTVEYEEGRTDDLNANGRFSREDVTEEREEAPVGIEYSNGNVATVTDNTRRVVAQRRSRRNRLWKKRFLGLKIRGSQRASE